MLKVLTPLRYILALGISAGIFHWTLMQHAPGIRQILPALVSEENVSLKLSQLAQQPYGFVFFISPLLLGLATGLFFLSMERDNIYGMFQAGNLIRLRIAGSCLWLAYISAVFEPMFYGWLSHTEAPSDVNFNNPTFFLLFVFGGWLTTLSNQGGQLFKHAKKLRSELDDIV